jgi:hypothetical protein
MALRAIVAAAGGLALILTCGTAWAQSVRLLGDHNAWSSYARSRMPCAERVRTTRKRAVRSTGQGRSLICRRRTWRC